ncbi:MAG: NAD-dependent epimerase/dehydratase family protein [Acidimicrobiia bacterium]
MIRGARILVTGGAGMVGSHIVDAVLARGAREVRVLDNFSRGVTRHLDTALESGRAACWDADLRDTDAVRAACTDVDLVFHQAAMRVTRCAAEPDNAFTSMAQGAWNLFSAAANAGVQKIVAASSGVIYGATEEVPTPETQNPYADTTMYGACKVFEEQLLRFLSANAAMDYAILRYANVYGPRCALQRDAEVLVRWMEAIEAGDPIQIDGDGAQTADFVAVTDAVRANVLAALSPDQALCCNVGTGVETSVRQLAEALMRAMGREVPIVHTPPRAVNAVPRRALDGTHAEQVLGFRPYTPLDVGLQQLVDWWRAVSPTPAFISEGVV